MTGPMPFRIDRRARGWFVFALVLLSACKGSSDRQDGVRGTSNGSASAPNTANTSPKALVSGEDLVPFSLPPARSTAGWTAVQLGDVSWSVPPGYTTTDTGTTSRRYTSAQEPGVRIIVSNAYQQVAPNSRTVAGVLLDYRKMQGRKSVQERTLVGTSGVLFWIPNFLKPQDEDFGWVAYRNIVPSRDYYGYRVSATVTFEKGAGEKYKQLFADLLSTLKVK